MQAVKAVRDNQTEASIVIEDVFEAVTQLNSDMKTLAVNAYQL